MSTYVSAIEAALVATIAATKSAAFHDTIKTTFNSAFTLSIFAA